MPQFPESVDRRRTGVDRLLGWFLPPDYIQEDSQTTMRMQLLAGSALVCSFLALVFAVATWWITDSDSALPAVLLIETGVLLIDLWLLYRLKSIKIPGQLLAIQLVVVPLIVAFLCDGGDSPALMFLGVVPVLVTYISGVRWGIGVAVVSAAGVIGLQVLELSDYPFPAHFTPLQDAFIFSGALVSIISLSAVLSWTYQIAEHSRKQAELALRQSEARFRSLFEGSPDPIMVEDPTGNILDVNPAACCMHGVSREEMIGKNALALVQDPERREQILKAILSLLCGTYEHIQMDIETASGGLTPVEVRLSQIRFGEQDAVLLHLRDISDRKRHEAELMAARDRAEEMARLRSTFLTVMSHEIRTPLTGIIGFADVLSADLQDEQQEFIQYIRQSGHRLLQTINSVLDLARLESGEARPRREYFDLTEVARDTLQMLEPLAKEKELVLEYDLPDAPTLVMLDRPYINRILTNLVGNAIKFTENGGVHVSMECSDDYAEFAIVDTGVGMSPEFLNDLYREFQQESVGLARSHEGTGLGLAIAKRLVDLLDGTIDVKSEKGRGTTFTVRIPRFLVEVPSTAQ